MALKFIKSWDNKCTHLNDKGPEEVCRISIDPWEGHPQSDSFLMECSGICIGLNWPMSQCAGYQRGHSVALQASDPMQKPQSSLKIQAF